MRVLVFGENLNDHPLLDEIRVTKLRFRLPFLQFALSAPDWTAGRRATGWVERRTP